MFFPRLFSWIKNKKNNKYIQNQKNNELIQILKKEGISDGKVLSAIKKSPRELFVDQDSIPRAYENIALPIECGQTVTQPYVVAYMISCLKLKKTDRILEVGTGTGWQTSILSFCCKEVFTIERFNALLVKAKGNIAKLKIRNVRFKLGNGFDGWGQEILFDAIIISAASEDIPIKLLRSIKSEGYIIMPKKYSIENQKLLLIKKTSENSFDQKELLDVKFVPLINKPIIK